jgi:hypothetical protein
LWLWLPPTLSPNYLPQANIGRYLVYDARMSEDRLSEDDCAVCGSWPSALRPAVRDAIFRIPLKQLIYDDCVVAFWDNVWTRSEAQRRLAKGQGC